MEPKKQHQVQSSAATRRSSVVLHSKKTIPEKKAPLWQQQRVRHRKLSSFGSTLHFKIKWSLTLIQTSKQPSFWCMHAPTCEIFTCKMMWWMHPMNVKTGALQNTLKQYKYQSINDMSEQGNNNAPRYVKACLSLGMLEKDTNRRRM